MATEVTGAARPRERRRHGDPSGARAASAASCHHPPVAQPIKRSQVRPRTQQRTARAPKWRQQLGAPRPTSSDVARASRGRRRHPGPGPRRATGTGPGEHEAFGDPASLDDPGCRGRHRGLVDGGDLGRHRRSRSGRPDTPTGCIRPAATRDPIAGAPQATRPGLQADGQGDRLARPGGRGQAAGRQRLVRLGRRPVAGWSGGHGGHAVRLGQHHQDLRGRADPARGVRGPAEPGPDHRCLAAPDPGSPARSRSGCCWRTGAGCSTTSRPSSTPSGCSTTPRMSGPSTRSCPWWDRRSTRPARASTTPTPTTCSWASSWSRSPDNRSRRSSTTVAGAAGHGRDRLPAGGPAGRPGGCQGLLEERLGLPRVVR